MTQDALIDRRCRRRVIVSSCYPSPRESQGLNTGCYAHRGIGSGRTRRRDVEFIYNEAAPIPGEIADLPSNEFLREIRSLIRDFIKHAGGKLEGLTVAFVCPVVVRHASSRMAPAPSRTHTWLSLLPKSMPICSMVGLLSAPVSGTAVETGHFILSDQARTSAWSSSNNAAQHCHSLLAIPINRSTMNTARVSPGAISVFK